MSWGVVIGTVVSVGATLIAGERAADAADDAASEEARLEGVVTREKLRQLQVEEEVVRGETIAAIAGSGVKVDEGSPLVVLADQAREYEYVRGATREAGASRAANALTRGRAVGDQARYGSYASSANSLTNLFMYLGNRP